MSTTSSSRLMSFNQPTTPDRYPADHDAVNSAQGMPGTTKGFLQDGSLQAVDCAGSAPARHSMPPQPCSVPQARVESDSEDEARHPCGQAASFTQGFSHPSLHAYWPGSRQLQHAPDPGPLCRVCRAGSLGRSGSLGRADSMGRRPSRELAGSQRPSRHSQDSLIRQPSRTASLTKEQLISLPPSPFSILHNAQHDLLRSGSSHDEVSCGPCHPYHSILNAAPSLPGHCLDRSSASWPLSHWQSLLLKVDAQAHLDPSTSSR